MQSINISIQILILVTLVFKMFDCFIRDDIMSLKGEKDKILEMIALLPQHMEADDIHDFSSLAALYSAQTPVSYKRVGKI